MSIDITGAMQHQRRLARAQTQCQHQYNAVQHSAGLQSANHGKNEPTQVDQRFSTGAESMAPIARQRLLASIRSVPRWAVLSQPMHASAKWVFSSVDNEPTEIYVGPTPMYIPDGVTSRACHGMPACRIFQFASKTESRNADFKDSQLPLQEPTQSNGYRARCPAIRLITPDLLVAT